MSPALRLLSAGAAQGLGSALASRLRADTGAELDTAFMPVGALQEAFLAGEPCDVVVSTAAMLQQFADDERIDGTGIALLGRVHAGIAVRAGDPAPAIDDPDRLRAALAAATLIHVPDLERSTAGIHFANVLRALALYDALSPRLATHRSGVAAMTALAADSPGAIGCTQVTEIRFIGGVTLVGAPPAPFDLATPYAAAVSSSACDPALARRFVDILTGPDAAALRRAAGFEP
jgi:molybdate transport system substrate-binding protein